MNIFSFCLYGTDLKYYLGLEENLRLINTHYPDYSIYIYIGKTRLDDYVSEVITKYNNVIVVETFKDGAVNMLYRYKPLLLHNIENVIIRDTDSEVNERDRYCINDFINDNDSVNDKKDKFTCQVIRDHFWHKSKITGGLTFFKCFNDSHHLVKREFTQLFNDIEKSFDIENNFIKEGAKYIYGTDENTLNERIYPLIKESIIVYTNICAFSGEKYKLIDFKNDGTNFCGNVIEYTKDSELLYKKVHKFNYFAFNILEQLQWLSLQGQHELMLKVVSEYGLNNCAYEVQAHILDYCFIANFYIKDLKACMDVCKKFYKYEITTQIKNNFKYFYHLARELQYKIIGTCDSLYIPHEKEIVIYYGNYPDDYMSLPQSNRIYKHIIYKDDVPVDEFKCHPCWNKIDKIFIMGLEDESERTNDTILQLSLMNAPLNRIHLYKAKKDKELNDIYIGATKNHLDCLQIMNDSLYETCLFLEDDFIFTSSIEENKKKLLTFIEREYDYDICFLSASKYHKRDDFDDLLILSKQICTTSSGYLINRRNINKVYNTVLEGYNLLLKNKDLSHIYCIDRYWAKLQQDNKVFIFKNKMGFQKPSKSKITGKLNYELD